MSFPTPSMGGLQAIALMSKVAVESTGATVLPGKIVTKLFHNYNKLMENAANEIAAGLMVRK